MISAERLWEIQDFIQGDEIMEQQTQNTAMTKSDLAGKLQEFNVPESWGTDSISAKDVAPTFLSIDPKTGDIKKSTTGEVLGGVTKDFHVIPVKHLKETQWVDVNGKTVSREVYKDGLDHNGEVAVNGILCKPVTAHIFFFLLANREHEGIVVYSARKTSRWACEKSILPAFLAAKRLNQSIAEKTFSFKSELKINDAKQKYFICHFEPGNPTTREQKALAYQAWKELSNSEEKINQALSEHADGDKIPF